MRMRRMKAGAALAALVATAGGRVAGDETGPTRKATLEFRVLATMSRSMTFPIGSLTRPDLAEGASTDVFGMKVNLFPTADEKSPCNSNVLMQVGPPHSPEGPFPVWQVEAVVHRAEMDQIEVGYAWKRLTQSAGGSAVVVADKGDATLSEGGRVLLDFVPVLEASSGCYRNVALELSAAIPEDPAFKDRRIGYDLWLVSEDHGKRLTRRLQLIGKQGENVAFDYGTFRSKLPVPRPEGSDLMEMTVTGSVRSRVQPDGSIELLLAAHREVWPSARHWVTSAHGSKRVRATAGETLRLELPPPQTIDRVNEPATFAALAEQHVALVLTPTILD